MRAIALARESLWQEQVRQGLLPDCVLAINDIGFWLNYPKLFVAVDGLTEPYILAELADEDLSKILRGDLLWSAAKPSYATIIPPKARIEFFENIAEIHAILEHFRMPLDEL